MPEDFHVDMSGKLFQRKEVGIACLGINSKKHNGCALNSKLIKDVNAHLFKKTSREENAKLYAICIYILIKDKLSDITKLIICNDEEFLYVKKYLLILLKKNLILK